nr:hypothetical protein [Clostridium sp. Cult1]
MPILLESKKLKKRQFRVLEITQQIKQYYLAHMPKEKLMIKVM